MKHRLCMIISLSCLSLFLGASWYGIGGVQRQLGLLRLRNFYDLGQEAAGKKDYRKARSCFRLAVRTWEEVAARPGFIPGTAEGFDGFLPAGNSYMMIGKPFLGKGCYEWGLAFDPYSISLLTALGNCLYRLGDYEAARKILAASKRIHPLPKKSRRILRQLEKRIKKGHK